MTRRTVTQKPVQFHRWLRLALSVSAISCPVLGSQTRLWSSEDASNQYMSIALEIPAFPLPAEHMETSVVKQPILNETDRVSRIVLVQRWLGLGQRTSSAQSLASSMVVPASALEVVTAVTESLSDHSSGDWSEGSIDPSDLLISLDEQTSTDDDTATSLSLSDREVEHSDFSHQVSPSLPTLPPLADLQSPELQGAAMPPAVVQSRQPQIVGAQQPMVLGTGTSMRPLTASSSRSEFPTERSSTDKGDVHEELLRQSSRRSAHPEPMKIQIVGSSNTPSTGLHIPPQREPLVAMLAAYPSEPSQRTSGNDGSSLKEMIQSDRKVTHHQSNLIATGGEHSESSDPSTDSKVVSVNQHVAIGVGESFQLKCENKLQGLSVEREEICQLIQTGPRSYSLVGLQKGATRIALITETDGHRQIEIHQVTVDSRGAIGPDLDLLAESIGQTIRQLYPLHRVVVEAQGQRLLVRGRVDSEESARKIISLVRKTALAPVVDQLTTY